MEEETYGKEEEEEDENVGTVAPPPAWGGGCVFSTHSTVSARMAGN